MIMIYVALFLGGLVLTILIGKVVLPFLIKMKVGQAIREDGPEKHLSKSGTPTMGGLIFILAALICSIFIMDTEPMLWVWIFSFLSFGLIGFLDDYTKIKRNHNKGLSGKQKLAAQFVSVTILLIMNEVLMDRGTSLDLFGASLDLGLWYYPLTAIFVVGMVNAVNLTDGLDGLAAGVSFITFIGYIFIGVLMLELFPQYEKLPQIASIMCGGCLGFLYFNRHPAKVFMGDTGSMALGGAVVGLAIICRLELFLFGLGLVYLLEAISVMLQVFWFKRTGKRLFKMAPFHHHFEMKGWRETKVTWVFYMFTTICVIATVLIFRGIALQGGLI